MSTSDPPRIPPAEQLKACQDVLGYHFHNADLLIRCLTHASAARTRLESNERIEFLGDAVLGTAACEALYDKFPDSPEGELTRIKSVVVSRNTCARIMHRMHLEQYLILGKGISNHSPTPNSVLATAFEAIIGGIYLDGGFEEAKSFVQRVIDDEITNAAESAVGVNYKSLFQQRTQRTFGETPTYRVLAERGPDHSKSFKVAAIVGSRVFPAAWGNSKKTAEQHAAHNAIATLDEEPLPHEPEWEEE